MSISLTGYNNIESGLFCNFVPTTQFGLPRAQYFSDYYKKVTVDGNDYQPLGKLLSISDTRNEVITSSSTLLVTFSAIPDSDLQDFLSYKVKGAKIIIKRLLIDPLTGVPLDIPGNPVGRFFGSVNNYVVSEEYDWQTKQASPIVSLECASYIDVLTQTKNGRRTNDADFRGDIDLIMRRVTALTNANINFGGPSR